MIRRDVLKGGLTALVLPVAASAAIAAPSREAQIRAHVDALIGLIREEFPEGADCLSVQINTVPDAKSADVLARASRREWETNPAMRNGGMYVDRSAGCWVPGVGRF